MEKEFKHVQTAHCENGVATSLLQYHGLDYISEPLIFGLGSGLFYLHIPFLTISNGPAISYRTAPGWIFSRACKSLGIAVTRKRFKDERSAEEYLDQKIAEGIPVACQVGVFHLPYFPAEYRFHFNAHNLIVFGKEGDNYVISDPVMETSTLLTKEELTKVRFARGPLAPKGHVYYPVVPGKIDNALLKKGIIKGIKITTRDMLHIPGSFAGVSGIKYTSRQIRKWREKLGPRKAGLYLGQIVRMQEEIGTGGGGFRFLYAAFLEQAGTMLKQDQLLTVSEDFTRAGDLWRSSAIQMARIYKGRLDEQKDYETSADMLLEIADVEMQAFKKLSKIKLS